MKRILIISIIAMTGSISFFSCSKSSNTNSTNNTTSYPMTANIGGTPFNFDTCYFSQESIVNGLVDSPVMIQGYRTDSMGYTRYPYITLYIESGYHGIGTYNLNVTSTYEQNNAGYYTATNTLGDNSTSGSITITSTSPYVVGTFNFITNAGIPISKGSFSAKKY